MKLSELKKGDKITIRCKQRDMIADVSATIADIRGELIFLELVRHDGQVLDFSSPNVDLIVIYEDGLDMPKAWTRCKIQRKVVEGRQYHVLASPNPSVRINRRRVSRVELGLPGSLDTSTVEMEITIQNISANGIGFVAPQKIEKQDHRHLRITFTDAAADEDEEDVELRLEARVAWSRELKEGGFFYGCRLTHAEENLGYYVARKMREFRDSNA